MSFYSLCVSHCISSRHWHVLGAVQFSPLEQGGSHSAACCYMHGHALNMYVCGQYLDHSFSHSIHPHMGTWVGNSFCRDIPHD